VSKLQGVVTGKNRWGILLDRGDWLNWSKEEYRKEPWDADRVSKGDVVELEVGEDRDGNPKFISSIRIMEPSQDAPPESSQTPPEPPEDLFPSEEGGRDDEYGEHRREKSLEQSVAYYEKAMDTTPKQVIETAKEFERYLRNG